MLICWSLSNPFAIFCWHQSSPEHPVSLWRGAGEGIGHCCKPGHGRGRHHWGLLGENSFLIFYFCSSLWELLYFGDADDSKNEHTWILLFIFLLQQYLSRFFFVPGHGGRELQWLNLCWLLCMNKSALVMLNCWIDEPILTVDYVNLFYICKILLQITQLLSVAFDLYCLFLLILRCCLNSYLVMCCFFVYATFGHQCHEKENSWLVTWRKDPDSWKRPISLHQVHLSTSLRRAYHDKQ